MVHRSPKENHKPIRIPLPHPLLDPRNNPVCLLVKDPQREYKDLLEEKKIKFISRVVGLEKLQGKVRYFTFEYRLIRPVD
jgi:ribosome biogenesis protein UTP30